MPYKLNPITGQLDLVKVDSPEADTLQTVTDRGTTSDNTIFVDQVEKYDPSGTAKDFTIKGVNSDDLTTPSGRLILKSGDQNNNNGATGDVVITSGEPGIDTSGDSGHIRIQPAEVQNASGVAGNVIIDGGVAPNGGTDGCVCIGENNTDDINIGQAGGTINMFGPSVFSKPIEMPTSTDAAAPNNSLYYSSTQSKLVYKDAGGTVHNLY